MRDRLSGIDTFRLVAALCVISLHVDARSYPIFNEATGSVVRLCGRWAVPFFFIVSGYMLGPKQGAARAVSGLAKAAVIFVIACLLMLPMDVQLLGARKTFWLVFDESVLVQGTQIHLWFLSSMAIGFLTVLISDFFELRLLLPVLSVTTVVLALAMGAYSSNTDPLADQGWRMSREFLSIPFVYCGLLLSKRRLSVATAATLALVGAFLQIAEAYMLSVTMGKSMYEPEFLIGTVPFAIGMMGLALATPRTALIQRVAVIGARYSLGIYILHPYLVQLALGLASRLHVDHSGAFGLLQIPLAFAATLVSLMLIDRAAPSLLNLLSADKQTLKKIDSCL
jgi:surface polysaccharide O-acyltransferase-like enzyme